VNGLDPEGVQWVRHLMRNLAAEGRTVLLSSHLMSEMALTADHIIVLGRGRVIADAPVAAIIAAGTSSTVRVRSPHSDRLAELLAQPNVTISNVEHDVLEIVGVSAADIGNHAAHAGIALHELTTVSASLEEAYMSLTQNDVEYRTGGFPPHTDSVTPTTRTPDTELQETAR
jgi:ABC-2 type transport system ATP-binding protein